MRNVRYSLAAICILCSAFLTQAADEKIRVACIGDSITFGAGVEQRDQNHYPKVLGELLGDKYETKNFGISGTTLLKKGDSPYWKQKAFKDATDYNPNIVVIKLGTNDTKPQNIKHKEEFVGDLTAMVEHFSALPAKPKVFLCFPAPAYATQWGINEKGIEEMVIPAVKEVAKAKNLSTIDLHTALSNHPEMFPDKIHPNAAGAKLLAKTVAEAITSAK
ncbi:MAG TPA: GDSL-type esterase/lipase family protein [Planctomycetota bacterium]|jgi:lysophospholipase L1-like esterase